MKSKWHYTEVEKRLIRALIETIQGEADETVACLKRLRAVDPHKWVNNTAEWWANVSRVCTFILDRMEKRQRHHKYGGG